MTSQSSSVPAPLSPGRHEIAARSETLFNWLALLVLLALGFAGS